MTIVLQETKVSGPLKAYAGGFANHVALLGYSLCYRGKQRRFFGEFDQWLASRRRTADELRQSDIEDFLNDRVAAGQTDFVSMRAMKPVLDYFSKIGIVVQQPEGPAPGALTKLIGRYRRYLVGERGILETTATRYIAELAPLLEARACGSECTLQNLKNLTESEIIAFAVSICPTLNRSGAAMFVTALRAFLTFLQLEGIIDRSMTASVPTVPGRRLTGLPKGIETDVLERLLDSCDRDTKLGSRRYAILLMLSRLGLRAGEVASLSLDDINWRSGEIVIVRGKSKRIETLPLPEDVGKALADYISRWRPTTAVDRTVFVRNQAPHGAMTSAAVTQLVAHAAKRCGFERISAHRLRHTAATQMLRNGASLQEIGQILRHKQMITTTIYAKVDRERLRTIARVWPGEVA